MKLNTKHLRDLATAATPGPWKANVWIETDGSEWRATGPGHDTQSETYDSSEPGCSDEQAAQQDAAFIAAMSPEVVIALLDELEQLRGIANNAASWLEANTDKSARRFHAARIRHEIEHASPNAKEQS